MQIKTKFFVMLLAFVLVVPCMFALTACNDDPSLKDNDITITVADKTYDGQAIIVTATATSGQAPIIAYKVAGADDSTYTTTAPKDAGEYVVSAGVEENGEYKAAIKTANFTIAKRVLSDMETTVTYNGQTNFVIDLADIEAGLTVDVTFASKNVGAEITGAVLKMNGEVANNYTLDEASCTCSIVAKEIGLSWTAPENLVFNEMAKVPTVEATGLIAGDECEIQKQVNQGDNVNVTDGGFNYIANGVLNANYKLPTNVTSPTYYITPMVVLSGLYGAVVYNGTNTNTSNLNTIKDGLTLDVTFENKNAGANATGYVFKLGGEVTQNYQVANDFTCVIAPKPANLVWYGPGYLKYNGLPKVVTAVINNLEGDDACTVTVALSDGNDNVNVGSFTYTATGLSNANYSLPLNVTSPVYTIEIDELTLDDEIDNISVSIVAPVWFTLDVETDGKYEVLTQGFGGLDKTNVYVKNGNDYDLVASDKKYSNPYYYVCFDGVAGTRYYIRYNLTGVVGNGSILARAHTTHVYTFSDTCYCGAFDGIVLEVGVTMTDINATAGETIKFRFDAKEGFYYYMTQTLLGADASDYSVSFGSQGYQSFDQDFEHAFSEGNAVEAEWDEYVYIYYTAPVDIINGTITIRVVIDDYGFSVDNYIGRTISLGEEIEIPALELGEKMFLRLAVADGVQYKYAKTGDLSIAEIAFYDKVASIWHEEALNTAFHELDYTPYDWYLYIVITSDGTSEGTFTMLSDQVE